MKQQDGKVTIHDYDYGGSTGSSTRNAARNKHLQEYLQQEEPLVPTLALTQRAEMERVIKDAPMRTSDSGSWRSPGSIALD